MARFVRLAAGALEPHDPARAYVVEDLVEGPLTLRRVFVRVHVEVPSHHRSASVVVRAERGRFDDPVVGAAARCGVVPHKAGESAAHLPPRLRPWPHGEHVADGGILVGERSARQRPSGVVRELAGCAAEWLNVTGGRHRQSPSAAEEQAAQTAPGPALAPVAARPGQLVLRRVSLRQHLHLQGSRVGATYPGMRRHHPRHVLHEGGLLARRPRQKAHARRRGVGLSIPYGVEEAAHALRRVFEHLRWRR